MTPSVDIHVDGNPLAPPSSRFALSLPDGPPGSAESPSAARPFGLRFAGRVRVSGVASWPPHRYCHDRQVLVTEDDRAAPLAFSGLGWEPTTLVQKDGKDRPQEDWKPDMPFSAVS